MDVGTHHRPGAWPTLRLSVVLACALAIGCQSFYGRQTIPPPATGMLAPGAMTLPTSPVDPLSPSGAVVDTAPPTFSDPSAPAPIASAPIATDPNCAPPILSGSVVTMAPRAGLTITPSRTIIAPVGSEVVLLAGVNDPTGRPLSKQRVEWMLAPDSVGQLFTVAERDQWLALRCPRDTPKKIDNNFAIGSTSSTRSTLTRGTPTQIDDVPVAPGQTWISLSSATGGVSHVTAMAPKVPNWDGRQRTATIHWIDAQFGFPAPVIAADGARETMATSVTRYSDGTPIQGWLVRYEIIGNGGAGFAPSGAQAIEVPTDANGQATVEIMPGKASNAMQPVQIEVIRPLNPNQSGSRRLNVGHGSSSITWSSPDIAMKVTGPTEADDSSTATFRFEVSNPSNVPLDSAVVTASLPRGFEYLRSNVSPRNVPADASASSVRWQLPPIGGGQRAVVEVDFRVSGQGQQEVCAEVTSSGGPTARDCASLNIFAPKLDVVVTGPETASLDEEVSYKLVVTNRSSKAIRDLWISDTFEVGLEHVDGVASPIEQRDLGSLQAGQSEELDLTFRAIKTGRWCHTVQVGGEGVRKTTVKKCVAVGAAAAAGLEVAVTHDGPRNRRVGDTALFTVKVTNTGNVPLSNVRIAAELGPEFKVDSVSKNYKSEDGKFVWTVDRINPGVRPHEIQLLVNCLSETPGARCFVEVVTDGGILRAGDAMLVIEPGPRGPAGPQANSGLTVDLIERRDEVPVGTKLNYEVIVRNDREASDFNVLLEIRVPQGLKPADEINGPSRHATDGQTIRFSPVAQIRGRGPDGKVDELSYHFTLTAEASGVHPIEVIVTSDAQQTALVAREETTVFDDE